MNTDTGAIAHFENEADAKAAGHDLMLTPEQAAKLLKLSRAERRAWAKKAVSAAELKRAVRASS